jgi:AraC family transcriptional regulator, transcriptional activator of pobA
MDGSRVCWYFSTMRTCARRPPVRRVEFHRTKYGRELLFDAALLARLPQFDFSDRPQVLTFHEVTLVTRGRGSIEIDGVACCVRPGLLLFTRPGDLRRFRVHGLDGPCFFFRAEFVREAFADPRFLDRFPFFGRDRAAAALLLTPGETRSFLDIFARMEAEMRSLTRDAPAALRALLYEMLVRLDRFYSARHGAPHRDAGSSATVDRFLALVERDFAQRRRLQDYAADLGLSPGHLSALCRATLGTSAGAVVRGRLALEARRLLVYGGRGAAEVGYALGFEDPAYFARFVKRETGRAPSALAGSSAGAPRKLVTAGR